MVGTPSCFLTGATKRIAGWKTGAKKKVIPTSLKTSATCTGAKSRRIPKTSSISEEPVFPDADLEPCFSTGIPAAAVTTEAIELMFTVPTRSPPVPTMSTASLPVFSKTAFSSMTSTKPASSATVSPLERKAIMKAPICASVASPDMISRSAQPAAVLERSSPAKRALRVIGQLCSVMPAVYRGYLCPPVHKLFEIPLLQQASTEVGGVNYRYVCNHFARRARRNYQ